MLILPLGHDEEIHHFPHITVGIIVICTVLQVYSSLTAADEQEAAQRRNQIAALRVKIWNAHGGQWSKQHFPELLASQPDTMEKMVAFVRLQQQATRKFFAAYESGRIVPPSDPDFQRLTALIRAHGQGHGPLAYAYHPGHKPYTLLTYLFLHGGWLHLIGNMIFLYLCGCNIEDRWGRGPWIGLYLIGGVAAALTWAAVNRAPAMPLVGASGAIAAAMGTFLVLNYRATIQFFYLFWFFGPIKGTFYMKAYWALPLWGLQQALGMWLTERHSAVAYSAHVGGFVLGLAAALLMRHMGIDQRLKKSSLAKATLFSQHPRYLEGVQHLEQGDKAAAQSSFEQVLEEQPDNLDAAVELFRLQEDLHRVGQLAQRLLTLAKRQGDLGLPLDVFAEMNQRFPGIVLDDRSLFTVAECYEKKEDFSSAVQTYERLLETHPQSSVSPKAMLNLAQLYGEKLHQPEKSRQVLEGVTARYDNTPFADRARQLLERLGSG